MSVWLALLLAALPAAAAQEEGRSVGPGEPAAAQAPAQPAAHDDSADDAAPSPEDSDTGTPGSGDDDAEDSPSAARRRPTPELRPEPPYSERVQEQFSQDGLRPSSIHTAGSIVLLPGESVYLEGQGLRLSGGRYVDDRGRFLTNGELLVHLETRAIGEARRVAEMARSGDLSGPEMASARELLYRRGSLMDEQSLASLNGALRVDLRNPAPTRPLWRGADEDASGAATGYRLAGLRDAPSSRPAAAAGRVDPRYTQYRPAALQSFAARPVPTPPALVPARAGTPIGHAAKDSLESGVRIRSSRGGSTGTGSGTIIGSDGRGNYAVLTAGHVAKKGENITIDIFDRKRNTYATVEATFIDSLYPRHDVALLSFRSQADLPVSRVAPVGTAPRVGERAHHVGGPNGTMPRKDFKDIASNVRREGGATIVSDPTRIYTQGQPIEGQSGGGLFLDRGSESQLTGVCSARDPSCNGGIFASLGAVHELLDKAGWSHLYKGEHLPAAALAQAFDGTRPAPRAAPAAAGPEARPATRPRPRPQAVTGRFVGDTTYRTENFIIMARDRAFAQQVGEAAERYRREQSLEWFGREMPPSGSPIPITVNDGERLGAGGATSFTFPRGGRPDFSGDRLGMSVQGSQERILDSVLPHEIQHTLFAEHFRRALPRWADEGAATTVEHDSERAKMNANLMQRFRNGSVMPLSTLFAMREYPRDILSVYSQGHSVTQFLLGENRPEDKQRFIRFMEDGLKREDWSGAARRNYGHENLQALQDAWVSWVREGSRPRTAPPSEPAPSAPEPRRQGPASQPQAGPVPAANPPLEEPAPRQQPGDDDQTAPPSGPAARGGQPSQPRRTVPVSPRALADFSFTTIDGQERKLSDFRGQGAVLLDFGSLSCGPCRASAATLNDLQSRFGAQGLSIVAVYSEDAQALRDYSRQHGLGYSFVSDPDGSLAARFGVSGIPHFVLVGADGAQAWQSSGFTQAAIPGMVSAVDRALAPLSASAPSGVESPAGSSGPSVTAPAAVPSRPSLAAPGADLRGRGPAASGSDDPFARWRSSQGEGAIPDYDGAGTCPDGRCPRMPSLPGSNSCPGGVCGPNGSAGMAGPAGSSCPSGTCGQGPAGSPTGAPGEGQGAGPAGEGSGGGTGDGSGGGSGGPSEEGKQKKVSGFGCAAPAEAADGTGGESPIGGPGFWLLAVFAARLIRRRARFAAPRQ